jgi:uncharacterized protein
MPTITDKVKKRLLVICGTFCVGLAIIGIVIPLLPTTPFLLLAAMCYMRGSQRLYHALLSNRVFGSYLKNYLECRAMSLKNKIWTLSLLWLVIILASIIAVDNLVVRLILGAVVIGVTVHIIRIKSESPNVSAFSGVSQKE